MNDLYVFKCSDDEDRREMLDMTQAFFDGEPDMPPSPNFRASDVMVDFDLGIQNGGRTVQPGQQFNSMGAPFRGPIVGATVAHGNEEGQPPQPQQHLAQNIAVAMDVEQGNGEFNLGVSTEAGEIGSGSADGATQMGGGGGGDPYQAAAAAEQGQITAAQPGSIPDMSDFDSSIWP